MNIYGNSITQLIQELNKLPGIGAKSAARIAFHIINMDNEDVQLLAHAISTAKSTLKYCQNCCAITDINPCNICSAKKRDTSTIMVVEDVRDMAAYERTREYRGLYHILHGAISPMSGIGPENLRIKELIARLTKNVNEVILATNPNVEGEATALYLNKLLKNTVKVTRIAHGVPIGGDLEYVDEITLARALEARREL